jgi:hypothetical protein
VTTVVDLEPPLDGYITVQTVRRVYLSAVASREPGKGHVGRLLAELQRDYDEVVVPNVISRVLADMLDRRGYHHEVHWVERLNESVDCLVWRRAF